MGSRSPLVRPGGSRGRPPRLPRREPSGDSPGRRPRRQRLESAGGWAPSRPQPQCLRASVVPPPLLFGGAPCPLRGGRARRRRGRFHPLCRSLPFWGRLHDDLFILLLLLVRTRGGTGRVRRPLLLRRQLHHRRKGGLDRRRHLDDLVVILLAALAHWRSGRALRLVHHRRCCGGVSGLPKLAEPPLLRRRRVPGDKQAKIRPRGFFQKQNAQGGVETYSSAALHTLFLAFGGWGMIALVSS